MTHKTYNEQRQEISQMLMTTHKLSFNKFGLAENPIGGHCVLEYQGRTLLGEVKSVARDEKRGFTFLRVVFMNGEEWPIQPTAASVNMLEREYESATN